MSQTNLQYSEILYLENLFVKYGDIVDFGGNLYKAYKYDNDRSHWNAKGFSKIMKVHSSISGAMFKVIDTDNDGTLDFLELVKGWGTVTRGSRVQRLNLLFAIFDTNNDKSLDKAEVKVMVRSIIKSFHAAAMATTGVGGSNLSQVANLKKAQRAAKDLDPKDLDAKFEVEVSRVGEALFKVCDVNNDGKIDLEEFQNVLSKGSCPEVNRVLDLFEGGSLSQWNALGSFLEHNGSKPSEQDYSEAVEEIQKGERNRQASVEAGNKMVAQSTTSNVSGGFKVDPPGCNQQ